jgi:ribulose-5-phosphate 4-epimerase/fuculose-1-phosphate aldolase
MKYTEFPLATITLQKLIGRVPIVSEADPGSEDLAQHVVEAFYDEEVNITALRGHGIVAAGDSLTRAYVWVDLLEHESKVAHYLQY